NVAPSNSGAILSVADDGPGLPAHEHQNVFKRFYRLERSRATPGSGLGLSVVAAVARLHGASIEMLDTRPGLTFRLRFPAPRNAGGEDKSAPADELMAAEAVNHEG